MVKYKIVKKVELVIYEDGPVKEIKFIIKQSNLGIFWTELLKDVIGFWGYELSFDDKEDAKKYVRKLEELK